MNEAGREKPENRIGMMKKQDSARCGPSRSLRLSTNLFFVERALLGVMFAANGGASRRRRGTRAGENRLQRQSQGEVAGEHNPHQDGERTTILYYKYANELV